MSKIFYDHLIILEEVETEIKNISETSEEKEELWRLVDEIIHHRVIISILDRLPLEHHHEFLSKFHEAPHHEGHLQFLNQLALFKEEEENIEQVIKTEINNLEKEILREIKSLKGMK